MNVVWTSYSCYGRVMVVLVTQEVATVVGENGNDVTRTLQRRTKVAAMTW